MKKEAVVAQLLYDKDTLVGRVVEVEDLTPEQIREALAHGAASGWKGDDDCWPVIDQRGGCSLQIILRGQDWKEIRDQKIAFLSAGRFEVVREKKKTG